MWRNYISELLREGSLEEGVHMTCEVITSSLNEVECSYLKDIWAYKIPRAKCALLILLYRNIFLFLNSLTICISAISFNHTKMAWKSVHVKVLRLFYKKGATKVIRSPTSIEVIIFCRKLVSQD